MVFDGLYVGVGGFGLSARRCSVVLDGLHVDVGWFLICA